MATAPPVITALPTPPDPNDRATFNTRAYPWSVAQQTLATEVGAVAANVFANATEAATAASTAATQAGLAATSKTNAGTAAALAAEWATKTDGPVSGGEYSAKKYAQDAAAVVATIPDGTINDATTTLTSVWSSSKVSSDLTEKLSDAPSDGQTYVRKDGAWAVVTVGDSAEIGDLRYTASPPDFPTWLPCDGAVYLQSSYTALYAQLGLLITPFATKLTGGSPSGGGASQVAWGGTHIAVTTDQAPRLTLGTVPTGTSISYSQNVNGLPLGAFTWLSFDSSCTYLAATAGTAPYNFVWKRTDTTWNKLADLSSTLPFGNCMAYGGDGVYLVTGGGSAPFLAIHKRAGDVFSKLANPAFMPSSAVHGCAISDDGIYTAVVTAAASSIIAYKRSGDTFTKLADLPGASSVNQLRRCAMDGSGTYLVATRSTGSPTSEATVKAWRRSGDTFTEVGAFGGLVYDSDMKISMSKNGKYFAVAGTLDANTKCVEVFQRVGNVFYAANRIKFGSTDSINGVAFSPDGDFLSIAHSVTPFHTVYKNIDFDKTTSFRVPVTTNAEGAPAYIKALL